LPLKAQQMKYDILQCSEPIVSKRIRTSLLICCLSIHSYWVFKLNHWGVWTQKLS